MTINSRSFRVCLVISFVLLVASSALALDVEKNLLSFVDSVAGNANQISWSSKYSCQDVQFIEDEMDGDRTVYARAWYNDHYCFIREYTDNSWSKSGVTRFWTDSDELTFANGLKIGSSVNDVKAFLGAFDYDKDNTHYIGEEGYSAGFTIVDNKVTAISFNIWEATTDKMYDLFSVSSGGYSFAEANGEKVNVRDQPDTSGKVLFQINKSKRDCLLVDANTGGEWCYVPYRIASVKNLRITPMKRAGYVSSRFIKVRALTTAERTSLRDQIAALKRK